MKFTCEQQDLAAGLLSVQHAVAKGSPLPVLSNILMKTDRGGLKLSATDLTVGINCWVDADVQEQGEIIVPAKVITDHVVPLLPQKLTLSIPKEKRMLRIKGKLSQAHVEAFPSDEFPPVPGVDPEASSVLFADVAVLKHAISSVAFAASSDDSRPVLTAVLVEIKREQAHFVAADAFRLAVRSVELPENEVVFEDILIPARTLIELGRVLPNEGSVEMIVTPNRGQVLFHTPKMDLVSRLLEGAFPNWRSIFPEKFQTNAVVDTNVFVATIKTALPFARETESHIVRIKVSGGDPDEADVGLLTVEATANGVGENVSSANAIVQGTPQQVIANVQYIHDILTAIGGHEVVFKMNSPKLPFAIVPAEMDNCTYIIMPHTGQ